MDPGLKRGRVLVEILMTETLHNPINDQETQRFHSLVFVESRPVLASLPYPDE